MALYCSREDIMVRVCEFCGHPLPPRARGAGRPKSWHPRCKEAARLITWLETALQGISFAGEKGLVVKRTLFTIINQTQFLSKEGSDHGKTGCSNQDL